MEIIVEKIRDALSYVANPKAEFIVSDGLNEYDTNLTISARRVAYDDDGQTREQFVLYIENPHIAGSGRFITFDELSSILEGYLKATELPELPDLSTFVTEERVREIIDGYDFSTESGGISLSEILDILLGYAKKTDLKDLQEYTDNLQRSVVDLHGDVEHLQSDVVQLQTEVQNDIFDLHKNLQTEVTERITADAELQEQINTNRTDIFDTNKYS